MDALAEHPLIYGATPLYLISAYLNKSVIRENNLISDAEKSMRYMINAQTTLLNLERKLLSPLEEQREEGASEMIGDLIKEKRGIKLDV